MKRWYFVGVLGFVALLLAASCKQSDKEGSSGKPPASNEPPPASNEPPPVASAEELAQPEPAENLKYFTSDAELENYLKQEFVAGVELQDSQIFYTIDGVAAPEARAGGDSPMLGGAGKEHSTTNIQEEGVDESDVVKTDGNYLYIASGKEVKIVPAAPVAPETKELGALTTIPVRDQVDSLYLYGRLLVVLYRQGAPVYWELYTDGVNAKNTVPPPDPGVPLPRDYSKTGVLLVDITTPTNPSVVWEKLFEGDLVSSRLTGGKLHLVQRFRPYTPYVRTWYDPTTEDRATIEAQNRAVVDGLTLDDLIPASYEPNAQGELVRTGRVVEPTDFSRPNDPWGCGIITVVSIDLDDLSAGWQSTAAVADVDIVYASTKALYLAQHCYEPQPLPAVDVEGYDYSEQVIIRKFDLTGEKVRNVASGRVWGRALNQFSLGEYEDVLRIATTIGWGAGWRNQVFLLRQNGQKLEITGKLLNIAPGERIYSARFIGKRGFLVTFVSIDPLFTLDLADPTNPKVVGELKVPGYSDYIHPLGENHLLTIGKDAVPAREVGDGGFAWYQGVQLSLFDVSDFAQPRLLHKEIIGSRGTESEALHNHKAFTFWAARDLLAIPIDLCEGGTGGSDYGTPTFRGLYVYRVTVADGIKLLGRISTAPDSGNDLFLDSFLGSFMDSFLGSFMDLSMPTLFASWTRGVFIGDYVYAVTPDLVKPALIDDLAPPPPPPPENKPPVVNAGPDQTVQAGQKTLILDGTVTDDDLPKPPGKVTVRWSQVSGPDKIIFDNASAVDTTANVPAVPGQYILRLAASDGSLRASDDVTITVVQGTTWTWSITSISPDKGPVGGGTEVGIMVSAEGYPWNTNPPKVVVKGVKIGDVPCEITRVEPTVLYIAISPDGSGGGMRFTGMSIIAVTGPHSAGICDVEVVMAVNGAEVNVSLPGGFTYVGDQVEVGKIVRVVPKEGPAEGGTDVTIALQLAQYSVGWYGLTNVDEVKIGGVACKVEGFGAYRHPGGFYIKAVTGAHPAGVCDVEATIRVADHTTRVTEATLVLPGGFTYKEKFEVITGVVRNDLVAIGGETTGWAIGETEVFPHPDLEKYLGQLVQATGRFEPHDYLERGRVQIFRIEKIEPAPR